MVAHWFATGLRYHSLSPFSREAAFFPAREAGGAVFGFESSPVRALLVGVSRVWVGLSRLGAEPLLRRRRLSPLKS